MLSKLIRLRFQTLKINHFGNIWKMSAGDEESSEITIIQEGKAKVGFHGPVFYNPVQEFNRDLTVTILRQFSEDRAKEIEKKSEETISNGEPLQKKCKISSDKDGKNIRILDALSASGLRALRFSLEVPNVEHVVANDFSENAVESIRQNVILNNVEHIIKPHFGDAIMTMMTHRSLDKRFHAVDLDPYGSASPFLDSAVQSVADEGILMVTCTDMAVLCGNTPEACYNKYDAVTTRMKCCHEVALRILLRSIDSHANRYTRYIEPLLSISIDFYVRVFVRVHTGARQAKDSGSKVGTVLVCSGCSSMETLPLLAKKVDGVSVKFSPPTIKQTLINSQNRCVHCDKPVHQVGPMYLAPIHNKEFITSILETLKSTPEDLRLGTHNRLLGVLTTAREELEEAPLYYEHDQLANIVKVSVPKAVNVRSAILNAGYKAERYGVTFALTEVLVLLGGTVSGSHCNPRALKTNAPLSFLWDIYRKVAQDTNVDREKRLDAQSAGYTILGKESQNQIDFKLHPEAAIQAKKENLVRFQCNKGKNWGPRQKAKGSVNSTQAGFQVTKSTESSGRIQGKELNATYSPFGNQTAHVYLGIPYAKPPLGDLRFRKTVSVEKWNGILETKEYGAACMSRSIVTKLDKRGLISEDCLYLNVFTNNYCMNNKNCSVMLVVHGGAYVLGSSTTFEPEILINNFVGQDRNIVVVTVDYRLGIFGFGHFNGEYGQSADHNVALYDLIESLKWTKREISNFGGLSNRVTVFGHSAGATLVFHLTTSPLTRGLIHQQIIMSGPISAHSKIGNSKATRATAVRVGCLAENSTIGEMTNSDVKNAFDCLRKLDAETLLAGQVYITYNSSTSYGAPYVDGEVVPDYPDEVLKTGYFQKINTLIGALSAELRETLYVQDADGNVIKERLDQICSHLGWRTAYSDPITFEQKCRKEYGKKSMAQYLTDDMEYYSQVIKIANANLDENTKIYIYNYEYSGAGMAFRRYLTNKISPMHSEDLIYVFGTHRNTMQTKDYLIEKIYSGVFADFINKGDPSPSKDQKWEPYTDVRRDYFIIDFDEDFKMPGIAENYSERANRIWNIEIPKIAGPINHMERFPPSFDTFICSTLTTAMESHYTKISLDMQRSLEIVEQEYFEMENFLKQLKLEYLFGNATLREEFILRVRSEERTFYQAFDILLFSNATILFACVVYITITIWLLLRKRNEYQILK